MTKDELHYRYRSILTDEYGGVTCNALIVQEEWLDHLQLLLETIQQHLIDTPSCSPVTIHEVQSWEDSSGEMSLSFEYAGGDDYVRGLVDFAKESYALLFNPT